MNLTNMSSVSIGGINLTELYINNILMWKAGILPAGYTQLDYIISNNNQYIDTGIKGHNGLTVDFNFEVLSRISADNSTIIGSTNSSSQRMYLTLNKSSSSVPFIWELGASSYYVLSDYTKSYCALNTKYHINISWTKSASVLKVDDVARITMTNTLNFDNNGSNMYIFSRNKGTAIDKYSNAKLYDMKMYSNGELVRDFIPAKYKDGTVGLYDLVSKSFFTNGGSGGNFTAGNPV